jgi:hypothetical protein
MNDFKKDLRVLRTIHLHFFKPYLLNEKSIDEMIKSSDYEGRNLEFEKFNIQNSYVKFQFILYCRKHRKTRHIPISVILNFMDSLCGSN